MTPYGTQRANVVFGIWLSVNTLYTKPPPNTFLLLLLLTIREKDMLSWSLLSEDLVWANCILASEATQLSSSPDICECRLISFYISRNFTEFIASLFMQEDCRDTLLAVQQINLIFLNIDKIAYLKDELIKKI